MTPDPTIKGISRRSSVSLDTDKNQPSYFVAEAMAAWEQLKTANTMLEANRQAQEDRQFVDLFTSTLCHHLQDVRDPELDQLRRHAVTTIARCVGYSDDLQPLWDRTDVSEFGAHDVTCCFLYDASWNTPIYITLSFEDEFPFIAEEDTLPHRTETWPEPNHGDIGPCDPVITEWTTRIIKYYGPIDSPVAFGRYLCGDMSTPHHIYYYDSADRPVIKPDPPIDPLDTLLRLATGNRDSVTVEESALMDIGLGIALVVQELRSLNQERYTAPVLSALRER